LWLKTLYRKRAVTWPFIFYTIIWTLSKWIDLRSFYTSKKITPNFQKYVLEVGTNELIHFNTLFFIQKK
ncbi:hypothetical protein, partial [Enterococcus faecium]|uniref:hypothetical protein n=1 Tax=Enterococcus faecium TaxID=1352 RepID=UPI0019D704E5